MLAHSKLVNRHLLISFRSKKQYRGPYPVILIGGTLPSKPVNRKWTSKIDQRKSGKRAGDFSLPISINDLKDRDYSGESLTQEERSALERFDRFRLKYLEEATSEEDFHRRYMSLQAKANLTDFAEFLESTYDV